MALDIEGWRRPVSPGSGAMYISPARICVTADGDLCEETDPRAVRLLVAEGGAIPLTEAADYGLIENAGDPQAAIEEPEKPESERDPSVEEAPMKRQRQRS